MASLTINAFYANGDAVGSSNVELNEGRLPVAAIKERFSAQHGLILDRPDGVLLVADHTGFSTRTFTAPGTVNVFLPLPPRPTPPLPKPVQQAEEFSLKMDWMQLLQFARSEAHAHHHHATQSVQASDAITASTCACMHAGRDNKKDV